MIKYVLYDSGCGYAQSSQQYKHYNTHTAHRPPHGYPPINLLQIPQVQEYPTCVRTTSDSKGQVQHRKVRRIIKYAGIRHSNPHKPQLKNPTRQGSLPLTIASQSRRQLIKHIIEEQVTHSTKMTQETTFIPVSILDPDE